MCEKRVLQTHALSPRSGSLSSSHSHREQGPTHRARSSSAPGPEKEGGADGGASPDAADAIGRVLVERRALLRAGRAARAREQVDTDASREDAWAARACICVRERMGRGQGGYDGNGERLTKRAFRSHIPTSGWPRNASPAPHSTPPPTHAGCCPFHACSPATRAGVAGCARRRRIALLDLNLDLDSMPSRRGAGRRRARHHAPHPTPTSHPRPVRGNSERVPGHAARRVLGWDAGSG